MPCIIKIFCLNTTKNLILYRQQYCFYHYLARMPTSTSPPLCCMPDSLQTWPFSMPTCRILLGFFPSLLNIINLFDISLLAKSISYTVSSIAMFLKVLIVCMGAQFPAVEKLGWISLQRPGLAPGPGSQGFCSIVPYGPANSAISFNIHQNLKFSHVT